MTTALQTINHNGAALVPAAPTFNLTELTSVGKILADSGFFTDAKGAAQAIAKCLAGAELGIGPVASMMGLNIINGKIALSANLVASLIRKNRPRYDYRIVTHTTTLCELAFLEFGTDVGHSSFSMDDASKAGLGGVNWAKFPRNMLFSRAMTNGARWYCPDIFVTGVYTADELGAEVDGETGEMVQAASTVTVEPKPPRATAPSAPTPAVGQEAARRAFYAAASKRGLVFSGDERATREAVNDALGIPTDKGILSGLAERFGYDELRHRLEDGQGAADLLASLHGDAVEFDDPDALPFDTDAELPGMPAPQAAAGRRGAH